MRIGVPAETAAEERVVAATPKTVARLIDLGYEVAVESGAGLRADISDDAFELAGATVVGREDAWSSDVVVKVNQPTPAELGTMRHGAVVASRVLPGEQSELLAAAAATGVTLLSLDAVPRISRAQSLDVLSTMSNVAGYRGVIEAARSYGGMFGGQVTAAGKTDPARVFVIGAGVAGLAAIGAANSLGAQVRAFDVRPEVAGEIESMGAAFVSSDAQQERSADGYARAMTEDQAARLEKLYAAESARADVVVTTALVRGTAPTMITAAMVAAMRPGSVIVDLAASGGGNCELTEPGEVVRTGNGVTIIGYTDLPSRMPAHTSQLYGTNIVNFLRLATPGKDGEFVLDLADEMIRAMTLVTDGEVLLPPPPVTVSAAPAATPAEEAPARDPEAEAAAAALALRRRDRRRMVGYVLTALAAVALFAFSPGAFTGHFVVFVLAVVVGLYVITNVSHSLHTPLMAQTNAVSGIILVGALLQIGNSDPWVTAIAFAAATVASINIVGGFQVAGRMIAMFRKEA